MELGLFFIYILILVCLKLFIFISLCILFEKHFVIRVCKKRFRNKVEWLKQEMFPRLSQLFSAIKVYSYYLAIKVLFQGNSLISVDWK